VDLKLRADVDGYAEVLVVKTRQAVGDRVIPQAADHVIPQAVGPW
jgi:hypothetical protein